MFTSHKEEHSNKKSYPKPEVKIIEKHTDTTNINDLENRFKEKLKILYWSEKNLHKAIPAMIRNAKSEELVEVLELYSAINQEQVLRLEAVFALLQTVPEMKPHHAIESLIKEAVTTLQSNTGMVRDAEAICIIQEIMHLKISLYRSLGSFARILGEEMALLLLEDSLFEEKQSDNNLSMVAEVFINPVAAFGYPIRVTNAEAENIYIITRNNT